jgi:hypothetical protein
VSPAAASRLLARSRHLGWPNARRTEVVPTALSNASGEPPEGTSGTAGTGGTRQDASARSIFRLGAEGRWFKSSRPDLTKPPQTRRFRVSRRRSTSPWRGPFAVHFFGEMPRVGLEHLGREQRRSRELLVVVQAVAGSSPVAHPPYLQGIRVCTTTCVLSAGSNRGPFPSVFDRWCGVAGQGAPRRADPWGAPPGDMAKRHRAGMPTRRPPPPPRRRVGFLPAPRTDDCACFGAPAL